VSDIDTAAIRALMADGYAPLSDTATALDVLDVLDAAHAELRLKDVDTRDMDEYDTRWFELHERADAAEAAEARIDAALALHDGDEFALCPECDQPLPCPTYCALTGAQNG
jgi:hypothetical protein